MKEAKYATWKRILSPLLVLSVLLYLILIRDELLASLRGIEAWSIWIILITLVAQWSTRALRDNYLLSKVGYNVGWVKLTWLNNVQIAANHLPLRAGALVSAALLKGDHQVSLPHFVGYTALQQLFVYMPALSLALIVIALNPEIQTNIKLVCLILLVFLCCSIYLVSKISVARVPFKPIRSALKAIQSVMVLIATDTRLFVTLFLLSSAIFILSTARLYYILYHVVDVEIGIFGAVVLTLLSTLSVIVSITPAGFGVKEAFVAMGGVLLGLSPSVGVVATVVERIGVVLGMVAIYLFFKITGLADAKERE